jgi:hypothetical protein
MKNDKNAKIDLNDNVNFFAVCGDDAVHPECNLHLSAQTNEESLVTKLMVNQPDLGSPYNQNFTLVLTEDGIDDLRNILYDISKQLMVNRSRRKYAEADASNPFTAAS